jgi:nucleoside-diphosphate-sugar epimerase
MARIAVLGYGAVGRATAARLAARGDEVRIVEREQPSALPPGAVFQRGDAADAASTKRACAGVEAVVCCIGIPYFAKVWEKAWPQAMANILEGCTASGARLIFADNLYMYGPQTSPLQEGMPLTSIGNKPRIRSEVTLLWQRAHEAGRVRAVAVRAADFYGPDAATSVLTAYGVMRLLEGKAAQLPYPPDQLHDFTYVPDFARALVSLVDAPDDAFGQPWHVPNAAPTQTLRALVQLAAARIGVPARVSVLPTWMARILSLFLPVIGETLEMRFQWDRPYLVDASKFGKRFWSDATSFEDGLGATIAFYRKEPGRRP